MERKLASIQKITSLQPIPGADKIELAKVLGWDCVVKKGEYSKDELVIYVEIDSLLPKCVWSNFLWREGDTKEKYRLRTVKLKGQISQGLVFPTHILRNSPKWIKNTYVEGDDVTDVLAIEKYVPYIPANLQGEFEGDFPFFIPKTDETRIQAEPWILEKMRGKRIYITEKLDGTSATYYLKEGHFGICSRNRELKPGNNLYSRMAEKYDLQDKIREGIAVQGEIIGQGVQSNKYKLTDNEFWVFNVYDINNRKYLSRKELEAFCANLDLHMVPLVKYDNLLGDVADWVKISEGQSALCKETKREGIVVRGVEEETIEKYGRFSFKVINPSFLLKYGDD